MNVADLLLGFMLVMTGLVVFARQIIVALIGLSLFSMFLTVQYLLLHAPDIAMTEAALGVGLSTLVFLVAIRKTRGTSYD